MSDLTKRQRLDGKVALITGATGGIGEACAALFLELGARVVLVGRSPEKLASTRDRLGAGSDIACSACDAADEAGLATAFALATATYGGLDILIANAGTEGACKPLDQLTLAEFDDVMRVNVTGVWLAMKHGIPLLKARGGGSIIALSSIAGCVGFASAAAYVASKHAVQGLVKSAAVELGPLGIRVNAVGPGPIDNRMIASIEAQLSPDDPAAMRSGMEAAIPLQRYGTNEEVAHLLAFLASDASSYCSGSIHMVDGGYVAA